jgi:histidine triad (HIT) family protein
LSAETENCLFCKIGRGEAPASFVYQDEDVIAFRDIHPQAPVHVLIVPRQHVLNIAAVNAALAPLMGKLVWAAAEVARIEKIEARGYRLVTNTGKDGGQHVMHLHWHLLGGRQMTWPPG